jgi:hypothetical protein
MLAFFARVAGSRCDLTATIACFALLDPCVYGARNFDFAAVSDDPLSDSSPAQSSDGRHGAAFNLGEVPDRYHR